MRITRFGGAVVLACLALWPVSCLAVGDSLCVRFTGTGTGETITLTRGSVTAGELPVTLCGLARNEVYRLELGGPGFERRVGKARVVEAGASIAGIRFGTIARNAVLPGLGSAWAGRPGAAAADGVSLAASLVALAREQREYEHLRNRLDILESLVASAATYEGAALAEEAAHETSRMVNVQNAHRRRLAALCGALYGWQAIEPILADAPPRWKRGVEKSTVSLTGARESRAKAFFYSLIRPGRGQLYQGKTVRGILFSTATLAAGLAALDFQNRYDEAQAEYDLCVERFEAAATVDDKVALAAECELLRGDAEDDGRCRNISLIALAAIWSWNCADTFFGGNDVSVSRYSLAVDARGAAVSVRF